MLVISPSLAELSGTEPGEQLGRRLTEALPGEVGEVAEASLRAVAASRRAAAAARARRRGRPRARLADRRLPALLRGARADRRDRARRHGEPPRPRAPPARPASAWTPPSGWRGSARWSWDVIADRWQWSDELFRIAGPRARPAAPPDFAQLLRAIPGEHRDAVRDVTTRALRDGRPYEIRFPMLTPDGRRRILRGRGVPVRGGVGRGRAHRRLRPGRHRARARREPAARGRRARAARALGRADRRPACARRRTPSPTSWSSTSRSWSRAPRRGRPARGRARSAAAARRPDGARIELGADSLTAARAAGGRPRDRARLGARDAASRARRSRPATGSAAAPRS